ncbi:amino acid ABC transporter permease [Phaeovulum sp.]|uniref:amino acid ABC transporter permease n=1 Tax=Phaeovulum sp. TaxID=2934796 RepID=UPI0027309853|nr:amino acid ABC transporter permease [Phaeovulum sp.]MDP1668408.1 amino acid ABC transporter permease [Phaeovulum sp.]MDZ4120097.1 amino acid ABC transporter permease [Phaeovulum sp.]
MPDLFADFFRDLAAHYPRWNFIFFYQDVQANKILTGLKYTVLLSAACLALSVVIGITGAWMQGSRLRLPRLMVQGYIQLFRNTPPFVQLLFFYFALGRWTPTYSPDGWLEVPIISNVGWAIISLSFFAGAFNVEIFRSGIEAVPDATIEASEALGMSRLQIYRYVTLPLAFRVSLPALNNNLVNLVKTTTQAFAIAVPELLYQCVTIWNDYPSAQYPAMLLMFTVYIGLVGLMVLAMSRWERALRIPGYRN